jgi:hypothetical protein
MDETPRLAPHRVRLVVCLLASNWRPVQTSSDLAGFWARLYLAGTLRPDAPLPLGDHLKTGHTLSVQNRPTGLAEDVIVLPRRSVFGQGVV